MAALCRLVALLAVLLMPFGMQPAAAAPAQHHTPMLAQHCPGQTPIHDLKGGFSECTMACAGALPATDLAHNQSLFIVSQPVQAAATPRFDGLHPDTATPPPKRS